VALAAPSPSVPPGDSFTGGIILRKDLLDSGKVKSAKDLKGMKIANGAKGIVLDYLLAKVLESDGVDFDAVEVVYLAYPDIVKGIFTPPSLEGTVVFPGFGGGMHWGGAPTIRYAGSWSSTPTASRSWSRSSRGSAASRSAPPLRPVRPASSGSNRGHPMLCTARRC
jgi:hypothetical protein